MVGIKETKVSWIIDTDGFSRYVPNEGVGRIAFKKSVFTRKDIRKMAEFGIWNYVNMMREDKDCKVSEFFRILQERKIS
jgi:hypothetical protein